MHDEISASGAPTIEATYGTDVCAMLRTVWYGTERRTGDDVRTAGVLAAAVLNATPTILEVCAAGESDFIDAALVAFWARIQSGKKNEK